MTNYAKGTGNTPVIVFRSHAERTLELYYAPAANYTDPEDDVYDFVATQGDSQIWNYLNQSGTYTYSPPSRPPKPPKPDMKGFSQALRDEASFTPAIRVGLSNLLHLSGTIDATALQQDWQDLLAVFGKDWLTATVKTSVETHAQKFNVPLVGAASPKSSKN